MDALRRGDEPVAARALAALADDANASAQGAWTAARLAIQDDLHRGRGVTLLRRLLAGAGRPARGWLSLSGVLRRAGEEALADELLARACALGEPGAVDEQVAALVRAGWSAHARGDRDLAIALLERAKSLHDGLPR